MAWGQQTGQLPSSQGVLEGLHDAMWLSGHGGTFRTLTACKVCQWTLDPGYKQLQIPGIKIVIQGRPGGPRDTTPVRGALAEEATAGTCRTGSPGHGGGLRTGWGRPRGHGTEAPPGPEPTAAWGPSESCPGH